MHDAASKGSRTRLFYQVPSKQMLWAGSVFCVSIWPCAGLALLMFAVRLQRLFLASKKQTLDGQAQRHSTAASTHARFFLFVLPHFNTAAVIIRMSSLSPILFFAFVFVWLSIYLMQAQWQESLISCFFQLFTLLHFPSKTFFPLRFISFTVVVFFAYLFSIFFFCLRRVFSLFFSFFCFPFL